jgi:hypothetical protein
VLVGIAATVVTVRCLQHPVIIELGVKHGFVLIEPIRTLIHVDLDDHIPALYFVVLPLALDGFASLQETLHGPRIALLKHFGFKRFALGRHWCTSPEPGRRFASDI